MLLKQFPDINFVRQLRNDTVLPTHAWKNVALNFLCRQASRSGVESPYSLFLNRSGHSYCRVNERQHRIDTDTYLLTQPGEVYDLEVDNMQQTEICNLHINRDFFLQLTHTLTTGSHNLLDNPGHDSSYTPQLFTQLYRKDVQFQAFTSQLCELRPDDLQGFDLVLADIVAHILLANEQIRKKIASLPALKATVRADIQQRLARAADYLHANYQHNPNLDEVCRETAISKFHFLRLFKAFYGVTPYQYLCRIRMEKATTLLATTKQPIHEISDALGFEYPNSFVKTFRKSYALSPMQYRKQISNFG
jgi:AraC-like DNA-binding protein